jgi:two-component system CheB/CheR fusion protein
LTDKAGSRKRAHHDSGDNPTPNRAADPGRDPDFEALLYHLRQGRNVDLTGYKRTTLSRRMGKRVQQLGLSGFAEYQDYLQVHPDEFPILFDTILINVTRFMRDPEAWDFLKQTIVPRLVEAKGTDDLIRVWSAGCASGQEAYSLAIVLAEQLGPEAFQNRVKIYATDVDDEALAKARQGYTAEELEPLGEARRQRFFERLGDRWVFRADHRRTLILGHHDLMQDAPISRLDLLVCRNALIYFTAHTQAGILARFHYALNDDGYLFLGKAEMLLTHADLFLPVDLRYRVFTKVPKPGVRDRLLVLAPGGHPEASGQLARQARLRDLAGEFAPVAQVVIDLEGNLAGANERARSLLGLYQSDLGRPLKDLELSYRPLELRSRIEQVHRERKPVEVHELERHLANNEVQYLTVTITPLPDRDTSMIGTGITFADVTREHQLQGQLERLRQDLETAHEELQSANEELETTNEELQSTVEELETTNEELQSSNEELETMNEELESTNSELQTINTDLNVRTGQLDQTNAFLESIVSSLRLAVTVLDAEARVILWNRQAEELWGLRTAEVVGSRFFELDIGLPVQQLRRLVQAGLSSGAGVHDETLKSTNRRGRTILCKVSVSPLAVNDGQVSGAVVVMEQVDASGTHS